MGDALPKDNNIVRYSGGAQLDEEGNLSAESFKLRQNESYLSVYCAEMTGRDSLRNSLEFIRDDIPLSTGTQGKLGAFSVGEALDVAKAERNIDLSITHEPVLIKEEPELNCEYHCGVRGIEYDQDVVSKMIADRVHASISTKKKDKRDRISLK